LPLNGQNLHAFPLFVGDFGLAQNLCEEGDAYRFTVRVRDAYLVRASLHEGMAAARDRSIPTEGAKLPNQLSACGLTR
jgi:hypothetical protein